MTVVGLCHFTAKVPENDQVHIKTRYCSSVTVTFSEKKTQRLSSWRKISYIVQLFKALNLFLHDVYSWAVGLCHFPAEVPQNDQVHKKMRYRSSVTVTFSEKKTQRLSSWWKISYIVQLFKALNSFLDGVYSWAVGLSHFQNKMVWKWLSPEKCKLSTRTIPPPSLTLTQPINLYL